MRRAPGSQTDVDVAARGRGLADAGGALEGTDTGGGLGAGAAHHRRPAPGPRTPITARDPEDHEREEAPRRRTGRHAKHHIVAARLNPDVPRLTFPRTDASFRILRHPNGRAARKDPNRNANPNP